MARMNPPKRRPRQQPYRKGESKTKLLYPLLQAVDQVLLDEANASARKAESNRKGAERFNRKADTVLQAMAQQAEETPFTAEAYQLAIEKQNEPAVQKWHDINTGFEAALMAQLGVDLGAPLLKAGYNWLRNKAVSPAARTMMNPENFVFNGPNIQPARINVPSLEELLISQAENFGGDLRYTLTQKPLLLLPQPKLQLMPPQYNLKTNLDIAPQDAGLSDVTDEGLFGIRLADTALDKPTIYTPYDMPSHLIETATGGHAERVINTMFANYLRNLPIFEQAGAKLPLPYITSVGDESVSYGFLPQWYKVTGTSGLLENMTNMPKGLPKALADKTVSPEILREIDEVARDPNFDFFGLTLFPEHLEPFVNSLDKLIADRSLFSMNVNSLRSNGLISPRQAHVLKVAKDPMLYFSQDVLNGIIRRAAQQYFKDIKLAKQKDFATRVMKARLANEVNADLNHKQNAVFRDLQGSLQPPQSLNSQIKDVNNMVGLVEGIGDVIAGGVENYRAWKADPNPAGWQLKYLMEGGKLERSVSKDGNISVNAINDLVKNASNIEKIITEQVLNKKFAGQSKINYSDFKHAVQNELSTYRTRLENLYAAYGLDRLGYKPNGSIEVYGDIVDGMTPYPGVNIDAYTFTSPKITRGSMKHFGKPDVLGHSRTFTTDLNPETMYVAESQSDWGLARYYTQNGQAYTRSSYPGTDYDAARAREKDFLTPEEIYLKDNWESRLIQENMMKASDKGLTKMAYPTEETAAKLEGYSKGSYSEQYQALHDEADMLRIKNATVLDRTGKEDPDMRHRIDELDNMMSRFSYDEIYDYSPKHKTILRKYSEFPKKFKKIYKGQEVREVTDANGNTWYEVDVPKNLRKRERAYSVAGTAVAGGTAASTLKPLKRNDKK